MNDNDGTTSPPPGRPDRAPLTLSSLTIGDNSGTPSRRGPELPPVRGSLAHCHSRGETFRVEGTNVVRVPFGVRQARRARPERPDRWVTLVLPFQSAPTPTPPQAA
ncbi:MULTISPECIES: hypothetical protein [unclassified Synechococcus]|uniref:hypothetical protein n=1 Tax=unclassified Synechococcus TaxID=2626047 RepID=UPI0028F42059|nr:MULTISPECIES: hypothetical protein [unclassified Synechococcus]